MADQIYTASVYSRPVKYTNFHGEEKTVTLYFALEPLMLMQVVAGYKPKTNSNSGDPRKRGQVEAITDEQQLKFIRDLCKRAAGFPSEDGESWEPYEDFDKSLAGQAFLTKLASSDGDRREFTEKVLLAPFKAFVRYAENDETNTPKDIQQLKAMEAQFENVFKMPEKPDETPEERRLRLQAELDSLGPEQQN
jgi:hypothetical protein